MSLSILCCLSFSFCACRPEVTVTSLHTPRPCRLAVFSIKPTLLSLCATQGTASLYPHIRNFSIFDIHHPRDLVKNFDPAAQVACSIGSIGARVRDRERVCLKECPQQSRSIASRSCSSSAASTCQGPFSHLAHSSITSVFSTREDSTSRGGNTLER